MMRIRPDLKERWKHIRNDPRTRTALRWLQRVIALGIIGLIAYQLIDIGWREVLQSLPRNPLFYLLFLCIYLTLPVAEMFIYRQVWPLPKRKSFLAFLTKKVYNHEVMGYSGEFYLFLWGRKRLDASDRQIFRNIRDNSILSSVTSNMLTVFLLAGLLYTGRIEMSQILGDAGPMHIIAGTLLLVLAALVLYRFRRYLFALPRRKAGIVFSIYVTRFILHHGLLMLMWAVAIPGTPWSFWFTFLALFVVVNRIPFLPSKDLVFMWAGIEFARMGDVTLASIAAMLLVFSALNKLVNLVLFAALSWFGDDPEREQALKEQTAA
ncbi:hypothetical protein QA596_04425 [Balneolales bacterium ANBcel1]|nr:hypothetical protein [Balneolales bacterium ANBcel1]